MITTWASISFGILLAAEFATLGYDIWDTFHDRKFDALPLWILWFIGLSIVSAVSMSPLFPYFFGMLVLFVAMRWWKLKVDELCDKIRNDTSDK